VPLAGGERTGAERPGAIEVAADVDDDEVVEVEGLVGGILHLDPVVGHTRGGDLGDDEPGGLGRHRARAPGERRDEEGSPHPTIMDPARDSASTTVCPPGELLAR
jgi:hypothetical protein